jgi:hypothetical protein
MSTPLIRHSSNGCLFLKIDMPWILWRGEEFYQNSTRIISEKDSKKLMYISLDP